MFDKEKHTVIHKKTTSCTWYVRVLGFWVLSLLGFGVLRFWEFWFGLGWGLRGVFFVLGYWSFGSGVSG